MSEQVNYIDDDYLESGFIAAAPGFHGALEFEFRPLLAETRDKLQRAQLQDVEKGHKMAREELARALKKWNLVDRLGAAVPHVPANISRLRPMLQDKLYGIVTGQMASDVRQDQVPPAEAEKAHEVEADLKN